MKLRGEVRNGEALGGMIQQGRMLRGLSQRDLAEELGISQKWIWEMENGKPGLFTDRLFQMLRATGCRLYLEIDDVDISSRRNSTDEQETLEEEEKGGKNG